MKYMSQACIPLQIRTEAADAALAFVESIAALSMIELNPEFSAEWESALVARTVAYHEVLHRSRVMAAHYKEAV